MIGTTVMKKLSSWKQKNTLKIIKSKKVMTFQKVMINHTHVKKVGHTSEFLVGIY